MTDPWRYCCPDCRAPSVTKMTSSRRPRGEEYRVGGEGAHQAMADAEALYRCESCGARTSSVFDAQKEALVQPDSL